MLLDEFMCVSEMNAKRNGLICERQSAAQQMIAIKRINRFIILLSDQVANHRNWRQFSIPGLFRGFFTRTSI